jgi:hypothetical protein
LIERCLFTGIALGVGVGQFGGVLGQRGHHLGRTAHDPDRLATPFDGLLLAHLQVGDVDLDRRTGGLGSLGRREGADERHRRRHTRHRSHTAGDGHPPPLAVVDPVVHYNAFTHEHPRAEVSVLGNAFQFSVHNRASA